MNQLREKLLSVLESTSTVNRRLVLFVFLFVLAIAAILVSLNSAKPYKSSSTQDESTISAATSSVESSLTIQKPHVFVHVVGEVVNPGIFMVQSQARLFDAIFAAGGFTKLADQSSINLAREVSDGEQIVVFAVGSGGSIGSGAGISGSLANGGGSMQSNALVSLNRASQLELESLPGVGPTLAGRMIDWRTANGGFKKKEDLLKVSGIGQKLFASMKDKLTL
ncbi:MAG: helix-hairpin-helix domain-containing protein [Rhodoluna sp.]|nr:helix-hairpin-helix domain-containing protein [Rhodoluna sp.]